MWSLIFLLGLFSGTNAFLFWGNDEPEWNDLASPWKANLFSGFSSRPRDLSSDAMGYTMEEDYCSKSSPFVGRAYWKNNDPTLMILFDVNGYVAGVQNWLDGTNYNPPTTAQGKSIISYNKNGKTYWVLTVYFVDPKIICNEGRSASEFAADGTGDRMLIQIGPNPTQSDHVMEIPLEQTALEGGKWTRGKCFYTMGRHYWYNLSKDMDCQDFFPYCILYNDGKLDAFCFASNAKLESSNFDSPAPSPKVLGNFMDPVPTCMNDQNPDFNKYSTIHVYMTDSPRRSFC